jgi:hypothetical protein
MQGRQIIQVVFDLGCSVSVIVFAIRFFSI